MVVTPTDETVVNSKLPFTRTPPYYDRNIRHRCSHSQASGVVKGCLPLKKGIQEKEATGPSHRPSHLTVLQWCVQPVLHVHMTSLLSSQCSSEDLSLQVVRASVALGPWGQESLQAGLGGRWFGSSQQHSDRQNQAVPALVDLKKQNLTKPNLVDGILSESRDTARIRLHTLGDHTFSLLMG